MIDDSWGGFAYEFTGGITGGITTTSETTDGSTTLDDTTITGDGTTTGEGTIVDGGIMTGVITGGFCCLLLQLYTSFGFCLYLRRLLDC